MDIPRKSPKSIPIYRRILQRLPIYHPTYIEVEKRIKAIEAGFHGECYVDNFLKQLPFPKSYAILKDLHIQIDSNSYLQMDTLILTKKYIALLEIKNIRGKIAFQKNPDQLIREFDGEVTPFKMPRTANSTSNKKTPGTPKGIKNRSTYKKSHCSCQQQNTCSTSSKIYHNCYGCDISTYMDDQLPDILSTTKFNQLSRQLAAKSFEYIPPSIAQTYPVKLADVKTGLICPICKRKVSGQLKCPTCKVGKLLPQQQAVEDWFYLMKGSITNRECVYFLELKDKHAGNYLLNKLPLQPVNNHKLRYYVMFHDR